MYQSVLFHNKKSRFEPLVAMVIAIRQYQRAEHTRGHRPAAVLVNPREMRKDIIRVENLPVYTNRDVPLHHIRVISEQFPEGESHGRRSN